MGVIVPNTTPKDLDVLNGGGSALKERSPQVVPIVLVSPAGVESGAEGLLLQLEAVRVEWPTPTAHGNKFVTGA